jgi:squalene-hopene/tetraprenyl-beta-curcumene cyclase
LKTNWPPYEVDDHFGVTLALLAVELAPSNYGKTEPARKAKEKLLAYLSNHPPRTVHQKGMLLWASTVTDGVMTTSQQRSVIDELFALQRSDGGWNFVSMGPLKGLPADNPPVWVRTDGKTQDFESSDGYATGFVIYVLRQTGAASDDTRIQQGIKWLKTHQRESGRWITRSPRRDRLHLISNAGTSFSVLALESCGQD